jgi:hypothetical protein
LCLYLFTVSVDALRKVAGLPASVIGLVYIVTAVIYIVALPRTTARAHALPRTLPIWLLLISLWCLVVELLQHISLELALLGWSSYVFFVPLLYVGAQLAADKSILTKGLRIIVIGGGVIGAGAIASAALGGSAPRVLQPIVVTAGTHTFGTTAIYLSPSFFATGEEASEQLLIAAFAWMALIRMGNGGKTRAPLAFLGILIASGLIATARRADLYAGVASIIVVLLLGGARALRRRTTEPRVRLGAVVFIAIAGVIALIPFFGGAQLVSFLTSGSASSRVSFIFNLPNAGSLVGQGPGTSTQGVAVIGAAPSTVGLSPYASYVVNNQTYVGAEGGLSKTWLELGIIGVALYVAIFWAALAPAIHSLRRLDGPGLAFTMLAIALGIVFLKGHQSLDDPLIQPLFWLAVGCIWGRMSALSTGQAD